MSNSSLGERMKSYENISRNYLTRKIPVIIRIDGNAFHTFTKYMKKPFDRILMSAMQETMKYLCENIQGCVFGYTQSDEITLVLTDYEKITTDAWFGYNIQKMTSIAASMATMAFNKLFEECVDRWGEDAFPINYLGYLLREPSADFFDDLLLRVEYYSAIGRGATFDARAFSIPKDEVCNSLIWRQQDATRNSIEAVGQAYFSHSDLQKKSCNMIQDMLWREKNINWNDFPTDCKRGACCYRKPSTECIETKTGEHIEVSRNRWTIDKDIPIFTQNRAFIEKWI